LDWFFLSIFRQTVRVSGVSRPIIRRYKSVYRTIGTYYFFRRLLSCLDCSNPNRTTDNLLKRIISTNCIHTVVSPDDGHRGWRNILRISCAWSRIFFTRKLSSFRHLFFHSHKFNQLEPFILRPAILITEGYFKQYNYYTRQWNLNFQNIYTCMWYHS